MSNFIKKQLAFFYKKYYIMDMQKKTSKKAKNTKAEKKQKISPGFPGQFFYDILF